MFVALGILYGGEATAMMLGSASGSVHIGQPLELSIPAQSDSPDGPPPCLDGELFHGDTRVDRFQLMWAVGAQGRTSVRVRSSVPVYEPIVTLVVRLGCAREVTRRYVFLADPAPDGGLATAAVVEPPSLPVVETATPAARAASVPASVAAVVTPVPASELAQVTPVPARPSRVEPARTARTPRRADAPGPRAAGRPAAARRAAASQPVQAPRPASRLSLVPVEPPRQAVPAAAVASQAQADEAALTAMRIKALETNLAALAEQTRKRDRDLVQMEQQLKEARDERDTMGRLLALIALVLAVLATVWAWYKRRDMQSTGHWWSDGGRSANRDDDDDEIDEPAAPRAVAVTPAASGLASAAPTPAAPRRDGGDDGLSPATVAAAAAAAGTAAAGASRAPAVLDDPILAAPRSGPRGDDELLDIKQQADFFISVGRHQHAFALLNAHASEDLETGALPWLDLLDMYQALGRRADFERVRVAFQKHFNASVPELDAYNENRRGLESHKRLMERIIEHWPKRRVLDIFEETLFRLHGGSDVPRLDLWSYRELLFLYQVALLIVQGETGGNARDAEVIRPAAEPEPVPTWMDDDSFHQTPVPDSELSWPATSVATLDLDLGAAEFDRQGPDTIGFDDNVEADFDALRASLAARHQRDA